MYYLLFSWLASVLVCCDICSFVFRNLSGELRKTLREYLEARGVNDELSGFLHNYMMNKDRIELIRWLGNVKSFVEK